MSQRSSPKIFPRISIKEVSLEPPSRLYCPEPIGIGTSMVESLTSYICRLADTHNWAVSTLIENEVLPIIAKPYLFPSREGHTKTGSCSGRLRTIIHGINGISSIAEDFVVAIESLTKRHDLRSLTLLKWTKVFTWRRLIRKHRAWCPSCYESWYSDRQIVYEPLIWTIDVVRVCTLHRKYLIQQCPHCNRQSTWLRSRSRPGFCSLCEKWLGTNAEKNKVNDKLINCAEFEAEMWVEENVGEIIASSPTLIMTPDKGKVIRSLAKLINSTSDGKIARFANKIGKRKSCVWGWRYGKNKPSLIEILGMCFLGEVSLFLFLTGNFTVKDSYPIEKEALRVTSNKKKTRKQKRLFEKEKVEPILQGFIECEPPLSMCRVAQLVGYDERTLERHFPDICSQISSRYLAHKRKTVEEERRILFEEVLYAASQIHSKGQPVTRGRIADFLNKPNYKNNGRIYILTNEAKCSLGLA